MVLRIPRIFSAVLRDCWSVSRWATAVMIVLTLGTELAVAVGLFATTDVLANLFASGPTPERVTQALPSLAIIVVALVAREAMRQGASLARQRLGARLNQQVEERILELVSRVEVIAFDDSAFNDAVHRVKESAPRLPESLLSALLDIVGSVIQFVTIAGVLLVLNPLLAPLLLLAVIPTWLASVRASRLAYGTYFHTGGPGRRKEKIIDLLTSRQAAPEVRANTMRPFLMGQFRVSATWVRDAQLRLANDQAKTNSIGEAVGGAGAAVVYVVLTVLLMTGVMSFAVAGTAFFAIRTALGSLRGIGWQTNMFYEQSLFYDDYIALLEDARSRLERTGGVPPSADADHIEVKDVSFSYPGSEKLALHDVSVTIRQGEAIALVGENGSGKTTLSKLLAGLYQPATGEVSFGGVPSTSIDLEELRHTISVISQDYSHWPFSARRNITLGNDREPSAAERFEAAVQASSADSVLNQLPDGAETLLDASFLGGVDLSGGQWQRIAIARGLYRDARILICDEPTAALDARAEHAVFEAIRHYAENRTVVLITHRMASVQFADRIYVLDNGRIAEHGTHRELFAARGLYHDLYSLQASAYEAAEKPPPETTFTQP
ncbi:ABC-type multidrug transport system, ATPase and permease component [Plantibacter sp. RU18]